MQLLQRMQDRIAQSLIKKSITNSGEITQYVILMVALAYCLFVHAYLLAVYFAFGVPLFIAVNAVSSLYFAALIPIHRRWRRYVPTAILISLQVGLYATFTALATGIDTYVLGYYVLVFVLQVILPYGTPRLRVGVFCTCLGLMLLSLVFHFTVPPFIPLPGALKNILLVSNALILALGTMVELLMGNVVKRIVDAAGDIRLAELTSLANTDPLTGLYNRRYAEHYLADILANRQETAYCVAMLDIDDFKQVNDTLGHAAGDAVLVQLAEFLTEGLRKSDMVFRWGGEEMLLILEDVSLPTAHLVLEKLRGELARTPFETDRGTVSITATIGVARLDLRQPQKSIEACDARLYQGKRHGKNVIVSSKEK